MKRKYFLIFLVLIFLTASLNSFAAGPASKITSFKPASVMVGTESRDVIIKGKGFVTGSSVSFKSDGITINSTEVISANTIKANITVTPVTAPGKIEVTITLPDSTQLSSKKFLVNKRPYPVMNTIIPNSGKQGETVTVTISGKSFYKFKEHLPVLNLGEGISVSFVTFKSSKSVTADLDIASDAAVGKRDVIVYNPDGMGYKRIGGFNVKAEGVPTEQPVSISVVDNETTLTWDDQGFSFSKIVFTQGNNSVTKIIEKKSSLTFLKKLVYNPNTSAFETDYTQFKNFTAGENVQVKLSLSNSKGSGYKEIGVTTVKALIHRYDTIDDKEISLSSSFPDQAKKGETINISGNALVDFRAYTGIKLPDKFVDSVKLETSSGQIVENGAFGSMLTSGSDFTLTYVPQEEGVYIFEINNYPGSAALNRPVYVGDGLPIVPLDNYFPKFQGSFDLDVFRQEWLGLINEERISVGLDPVILDDTLNNAAQAHTDDMKARDFFGHINPDNQTPQDRAEAAGVPIGAEVGENLSLSSSVLGMEVGLEESPVHEANILNPRWYRVGLGITQKDGDSLLGAQEFGVYPGDLPLSVNIFKDNGIILDNPLPTLFPKDTEVLVTGTVSKSGTKVVIFFTNDSPSINWPQFYGNISNNKFSISVKFTPDQVGNYSVGMVIGGGQSYVYPIIVKKRAMLKLYGVRVY